MSLYFKPQDCRADARAELEAALAGNGDPLADLMTRCSLTWNNRFEVLFAALGSVTRGRDRLAERFRFVHDDYESDLDYHGPFGVMHVSMVKRDLANLLGDTQAASRYQGIIDRHVGALSDRKRLVALLLWQHIGRIR